MKIPNLWDIVALFVGPVEPDPDPEHCAPYQVEFIAYAPLWVQVLEDTDASYEIDDADELGMDDPEADGVPPPGAEASADYGPCDRVAPEPEAEPG